MCYIYRILENRIYKILLRWLDHYGTKQFICSVSSMLCVLSLYFLELDHSGSQPFVYRESPGSNPLCHRFELWAFSFSSRRLSRLSCINEYLSIDRGDVCE